jgi:hypothetical protein
MQARFGRFAAIIFLAILSRDFAQAQTLDTTTFVVMGEGLAAGMANFGLNSIVQSQSFPAQIAAQMKTAFPQPLIQPPGIGDVIGYPGQEVRVQTYPQGSVRNFYQPSNAKDPAAPPLFILNLSVPGFTVADSVSLKPVAPIVQQNMKQTVVNLILGFPQLFFRGPKGAPVPLWTQFEYAKTMFPTASLIELGYYEALDAAVNGEAGRLPDPNTFAATYGTIVKGLRDLQAQVIVTTIPNPLDTAYFSTPATAASLTAVEPAIISSGYSVGPQDYVTRTGLLAISNQVTNGSIGTLPKGSILNAATAAAITSGVGALNAQIIKVAQTNGAVVYDLNAYLHKIRLTGAVAGTRTLTADYFGGFYSLDAVYPGPTGHALIANDILAFLNQTYHQSFPLVDVKSVADADSTLQMRKPAGQIRTAASLGIQE